MIMKYKNAWIPSAMVNLTEHHNFEKNILKLNYSEFYAMLYLQVFLLKFVKITPQNHLVVKHAEIFSYQFGTIYLNVELKFFPPWKE